MYTCGSLVQAGGLFSPLARIARPHAVIIELHVGVRVGACAGVCMSSSGGRAHVRSVAPGRLSSRERLQLRIEHRQCRPAELGLAAQTSVLLPLCKRERAATALVHGIHTQRQAPIGNGELFA